MLVRAYLKESHERTSFLLSRNLQALMSCPVPEDPQDAVVARQYLANKGDWQNTGAWEFQFFFERCVYSPL